MKEITAPWCMPWTGLKEADDKCKDIPLDYYGEMGVPSSYLVDHDPTQFEIVGTSTTFAGGAFDNRDGKLHKKPGRFYVNGDRKTERIVIRRRV